MSPVDRDRAFYVPHMLCLLAYHPMRLWELALFTIMEVGGKVICIFKFHLCFKELRLCHLPLSRHFFLLVCLKHTREQEKSGPDGSMMLPSHTLLIVMVLYFHSFVLSVSLTSSMLLNYEVSFEYRFLCSSRDPC